MLMEQAAFLPPPSGPRAYPKSPRMAENLAHHRMARPYFPYHFTTAQRECGGASKFDLPSVEVKIGGNAMKKLTASAAKAVLENPGTRASVLFAASGTAWPRHAAGSVPRSSMAARQTICWSSVRRRLMDESIIGNRCASHISK